MPATRIHRYLLREIAVPTTLGLVVFTFVLLMGRMLRLTDLVISKGVPPGEIARLFVCLLPTFLVLTVPLAVLLGILVGFGRLSADSEIIALKSSGFSLYSLLLPALGLAVPAALLTAWLTLEAEPAGYAAFRNQVFQIAASRASVGFQPQVFNDEFQGLVFYANEIEERTGSMRDVFISDERVGATPSTIVASRGRIISDRDAMTLVLRLEGGTIHRRPPKDPNAYQVVRFDRYDLQLHLGPTTPATGRQKKTKELTFAELREGLRSAAEEEERRTLAAQLHRRLTLPLAPVLFALVGVPLGIHSQRSGRGGGFAIGLAVFLAYYLLQSLAETLTVEVGLPAAATMWTPSLLFLAGGMYLLQISAREKRLTALDWTADRLRRLSDRLRRTVPE
jgi:lipopolysaccharide export system permease protein